MPFSTSNMLANFNSTTVLLLEALPSARTWRCVISATRGRLLRGGMRLTSTLGKV